MLRLVVDYFLLSEDFFLDFVRFHLGHLGVVVAVVVFGFFRVLLVRGFSARVLVFLLELELLILIDL